MNVGTEGEALLCCVAYGDKPIDSNIIGKDVNEVWTSEAYKKVRQDMLDGKPVKHCNKCYKEDALGGGSDRQTHNKRFVTKKISNDVDINVETGNNSGAPIWVDLRPGKFCNLACTMCFVRISSGVYDEHVAHPELGEITGETNLSTISTQDWIENDITFESIKKWIPKLTTIKLAGGEPFFMPGVIKLLNWCVDTNNTHLHLDITTNGTRTEGKVLKLLKKFNSVSIQLSMDGIGITNDYIRHKGDWNKVNNAYNTYLSTSFNVNLLSTVQAYNAFELVNIIKYWVKKGQQYILLFNFVDWPPDMGIDILPITDRQQIAKKIEDLVKDFPEELKEQSRINAVIYRLKNNKENINLQNKWAKRTQMYDRIRNKSIFDIHPKLGEYFNKWI
jgi:sulfatase maturation enzyme AslB (radical SAM superfamily)